MNTAQKDPASDIWGAVLKFEEVTNRLERIERVARMMATSHGVSDRESGAIEGLADLIDACREETGRCQDEFAALSGSYREAAQ